MVRNKRDVIFKPAVTSITSVVARCLPFPKTLKSTIYLSFSANTTEGDGQKTKWGENDSTTVSSVCCRKACLQKRKPGRHTKTKFCVEHERDVPLLVEIHTQKKTSTI